VGPTGRKHRGLMDQKRCSTRRLLQALTLAFNKLWSSQRWRPFRFRGLVWLLSDITKCSQQMLAQRASVIDLLTDKVMASGDATQTKDEVDSPKFSADTEFLETLRQMSHMSHNKVAGQALVMMRGFSVLRDREKEAELDFAALRDACEASPDLDAAGGPELAENCAARP